MRTYLKDKKPTAEIWLVVDVVQHFVLLRPPAASKSLVVVGVHTILAGPPTKHIYFLRSASPPAKKIGYLIFCSTELPSAHKLA